MAAGRNDHWHSSGPFRTSVLTPLAGAGGFHRAARRVETAPPPRQGYEAPQIWIYQIQKVTNPKIKLPFGQQKRILQHVLEVGFNKNGGTFGDNHGCTLVTLPMDLLLHWCLRKGR